MTSTAATEVGVVGSRACGKTGDGAAQCEA